MKKSILLILTLVAVLNSCQKVSTDCTEDNYTYNNQVKPIIDMNCNISGCHVQGASIGDMSDYSSLEIFLKNGKFNIHLFVKKDMPKGKVLSAEDENILKCWYDSGFDEKL